MSSNSNNNNSSGVSIGFTGLLQIAFIVLKLCKVIDWSWWLVFAPTWISVGFCILLLVFLVAAMLVKHSVKKAKNKRNRD